MGGPRCAHGYLNRSMVYMSYATVCMLSGNVVKSLMTTDCKSGMISAGTLPLDTIFSNAAVEYKSTGTSSPWRVTHLLLWFERGGRGGGETDLAMHLIPDNMRIEGEVRGIATHEEE